MIQTSSGERRGATPAGKDVSEDMKSGFLFRAEAVPRKASPRSDPERRLKQLLWIQVIRSLYVLCWEWGVFGFGYYEIV